MVLSIELIAYSLIWYIPLIMWQEAGAVAAYEQIQREVLSCLKTRKQNVLFIIRYQLALAQKMVVASIKIWSAN